TLAPEISIGKLALSRRVALGSRCLEPFGGNSLVRRCAESLHEAGGDAVLGLSVACLREWQPHGDGRLVRLCGEEPSSFAKLLCDRGRGCGFVATEREPKQLHGSASAS